MTQDDPAVPLRHKCSPSRPSSALCGPPAGRWGSIPGRSTAGSGSCTATAPEILAQAPGPTCRCPTLNERRRAFSPRRDRRPGRGHSCPLRALVSVGAYGGLRIGEPAGLRPSRVDLLAGAVTVAEILTEVKGKLIAGPPKTCAGRRAVGLPPFVVRELEAHLAVAQRPGSHVYTAPGGGRCGPGLSGALLGAGDQSSTPAGPCISTTFATPPWRCGSPPARRPRRSPCGGHASVSFTLTATATRRSHGRSRRARCHPVGTRL